MITLEKKFLKKRPQKSCLVKKKQWQKNLKELWKSQTLKKKHEKKEIRI